MLLAKAGYALVATLLAAAPAATAASGDLGVEWQDRLRRADRQIRKGRHAEAESAVRGVLREMIELPVSGETLACNLSLAALLLALAELGQEQIEAATWDWHVALALCPRFAAVDLGAYDKQAAVSFDIGCMAGLERQLALELVAGQDLEVLCDDSAAAACELARSSVQRPQKLDAPPPVYPPGARRLGASGKVVIEALLATDGRLRHPAVVSQPEDVPVLAYTALDALRSWRFEPARMAGDPVPVIYRLAVSFRLEGADD